MGPHPPHQDRIYKLQLVSTLIQTYALLIVINSFEGPKQKGPGEANQTQALSERDFIVTHKLKKLYIFKTFSR